MLVLRAQEAPDRRADPLWSAISIDGTRARVAQVPREPGDITIDVPASLVRGPTSLVTLEFGDWLGRGAATAPHQRADAAGVERLVVR